jgi:hypothetical protein
MVAVPLREADGLSGAFPEVIKFGTSGFSASNWFYVEDVGRMDGEDSFDAFVVNDSSYGEGLVYAPAFSANYCSCKDLYAFLVAFLYFAADVDDVADFEVRNFFL